VEATVKVLYFWVSFDNWNKFTSANWRTFSRLLHGWGDFRRGIRSKNLDLPYDEYGRVDLDEMDDSECISEFRVKKGDLQIPNSFTCYQGSESDGMEGLCMLLRRLAYPCRYSDMIHRFGRPTPVLSMVTNKVIYAKGAALDNCFGFIDRRVRPIARPGEFQRVVYNGQKSPCTQISIFGPSKWNDWKHVWTRCLVICMPRWDFPLCLTDWMLAAQFFSPPLS